MDDEQRGKEDSEEAEPTIIRTGRVRIIGAESAGRSLAGDPADPIGVEPSLDEPEPLPPWPGDDEPSAATELPHWTEAPTGEVPAVLSRDSGDEPDGDADPWSSLPAPTWREEHTDWTADEETFEPSMLAQDDARLGSLDDSGQSDRQPWSFDLPTAEGPPGSEDEPAEADDRAEHDLDTMVVPAVGRSLTPEEPEEVAFRFDEVDAPLFSSADSDRTVEADTGPSEADEARTATEEPDSIGRSPATPDALADADGPDSLADGPDGVAAPRMGRTRRGLGRPPRRRAPAHESRTSAHGAPPSGQLNADADVGPDDQAELDGAGGALSVTDRPPTDRPVPPAPATREGRPLQPGSRPVPPAPPGPRRMPSRPRPGGGLRPPEVTIDTRSGRDLPVAVASGLVLGVLALVCFKLGTVAAMIVVTAVVTLAAMEAYAAFRKAGYHPATLLGLVATVSLMVATYNKGQAALPLVLVLLVAFTMLWHLAGVDRAAEPVRSTASTLLVFCWVGVFGSFAALLLDPTLFPDRHGIAFLLGAVITGVAYDVGALAVGAWIGRHPLSTVSPNKTWEGLIGGAVASVVVAVVVVHLIHPWTVGTAAGPRGGGGRGEPARRPVRVAGQAAPRA